MSLLSVELKFTDGAGKRQHIVLDMDLRASAPDDAAALATQLGLEHALTARQVDCIRSSILVQQHRYAQCLLRSQGRAVSVPSELPSLSPGTAAPVVSTGSTELAAAAHAMKLAISTQGPLGACSMRMLLASWILTAHTAFLTLLAVLQPGRKR